MVEIQIDLRGGLGNQLFGGALALALVCTFEEMHVKLSDRLVPLGVNPTRNLQIDRLGLFDHERIEFTNTSSLVTKVLARSKISRRIWWKVKRLQMRNSIITDRDIWSESLKSTKNAIFSDYFNNWFYVEHASKAMPDLPILNFPNMNIVKFKEYIEDDNVIAIHCRIGDYLKIPESYSILHETYFLNAIKRIQKKRAAKCEVIVFCESLEEFKKFYPNLAKMTSLVLHSNVVVPDTLAFSLMCRAHNLIASNSTFSSWAAWFVQRRGFVAIRPVNNRRSAEEDGSVYLNWTNFDIETESFFSGNTLEKKSWLNSRNEQFVKLGKYV